jgi:hypothetical protein
MKKTTIGRWAKKNDATIRNCARWNVIRDAGGTHASVRLSVIVVRHERPIAEAALGEVLRGGDEPRDAQWEQGSPEAGRAKELCRKAEDMDMSNLDTTIFKGYSYALPWEIAKQKKTIWSRIKRFITEG